MRFPEYSNSEMESRMVVARDWGLGEMGSQYLMGMEFQFGEMRKVLEINGVLLQGKGKHSP